MHFSVEKSSGVNFLRRFGEFFFNHGKESCIIDILITDFIKVTAVWLWLVCTPPYSYNDSGQVVVTLHFPFIFPPSLGFFCSLQGF